MVASGRCSRIKAAEQQGLLQPASGRMACSRGIEDQLGALCEAPAPRGCDIDCDYHIEDVLHEAGGQVEWGCIGGSIVLQDKNFYVSMCTLESPADAWECYRFLK